MHNEMFFILQMLNLFALETHKRRWFSAVYHNDIICITYIIRNQNLFSFLSIHDSIDFLQIPCITAEIYSNPEDMQSYTSCQLFFWHTGAFANQKSGLIHIWNTAP